MPISCVFQLNRENLIYTAGEDINGSIILNTQEVIEVNGVFVTLEGEAEVELGNSDDQVARKYYDKQRLLNHRVKVFDGTSLPAGKHVYRISTRIPPECPSSFKGIHGHISYSISVKLDRHWNFDKVFRTPIVVYQALDLNYNPKYMLPVKDVSIKSLCRWTCRSGPILSTLVIPHVGYVPQQNIPFTLNIDNQSQYDIAGVETSLYQHTVFLARNPGSRLLSEKLLAEVVLDKSTLRLSKRLYKGSVVVPPNAQRSTLNDNIIVSLHYKLHAKIKTGRFHKDIIMKVPIVIGTVELRCWPNDNIMVAVSQPTAFTGQSSISQFNRAEIPNDIVTMTNLTSNDGLPSNASCLPPATSSGPDNLHSCPAAQPYEQHRLVVNLQQFPGYNTFANWIQAENSVVNHTQINNNYAANSRQTPLLAIWRSLNDFGVSPIGRQNISEENST